VFVRILLLKPPVSRGTVFLGPDPRTRVYPLRFAYLAAELSEAGATVSFVDSPLRGYDRHAAAGAVFADHPDVIYAELDPREAGAQLEFLRRVKELGPARIVLGGFWATLLTEPILNAVEAVDAVVRGEVDETLLDLVARWHEGLPLTRLPGIGFRSHRKPVVSPERGRISDLDSLPFPDREIVPLYDYQAGRLHHRPFTLVAGSRGCARSCRFCRRGGGKDDVRRRSVGNVVREVEELVRRYGVREIRFVDPVFNADRAWSVQVAEALVPCGVVWQCSVRAESLTPEELRAYRRAGCRDVFFSPVAPTRESAERLKTGDDPEAVKEAVAAAAAEDVRAHVRVITGDGELPPLKEAEAFAASLKGCRVVVRYVRAQPGSDLHPDLPSDFTSPQETRDLSYPSGASPARVRFWSERIRALWKKPRAETCADASSGLMN